MSWKETCVVDERMRFVSSCREDLESFSFLCRRFGVSRKTGYKWLSRYHLEGPSGLEDQSRAPHRSPQSISSAQAEVLLALRYRHPHWGPRKIKAYLERQDDLPWPAASSIGLLYDRAGLTKPRKRKRRVEPMTYPFSDVLGCNDTWCIDFKGWFRTGDGVRIDPLTLSDAFSRYLLLCEAVDAPDEGHVWPAVEAAFREHGLPRRLRSDNGPPFASVAAGGLSRLGVKLIKAGVAPERIEPGKPQQNGRHERMHLTLKQETAQPPAMDARAQDQRFEDFLRVYNNERPHEALGQVPPAEVYRPSPRSYQGLRSPDYDDTCQIRRVRRVRRVRSKGEIKWRGNLIFVSQALAGEPVSLTEIDDDVWMLAYGPIKLGAINGREGFRKNGSGACSRAKPYGLNKS